ncbi:MAG: SCP2 sterol-binding domain-containing protein [Hahellaceae bacterium]|nr:SCP2 sterol-binding domain-containing protein [Hahellaceae bacterium]MCP5212076.1 SCP2 sterol-binding domain-containing protein [Hahellaceae bacterium]
MYKELPLLATKPLMLLPFRLHAFLFESVLSKVFRAQIEDGTCNFMRQRWLQIKISDLGATWYFSLDPQNRIIMSKNAFADVSITGNLNEFILLAAQREDPDTLFFQRRLMIEGDTELGLEIKNLMDSADLQLLSKELRFLISGAGEWVTLSTG